MLKLCLQNFASVELCRYNFISLNYLVLPVSLLQAFRDLTLEDQKMESFMSAAEYEAMIHSTMKTQESTHGGRHWECLEFLVDNDQGHFKTLVGLG